MGAWNIQWWGRVRSAHHRLGMSSITCAARYTSHQTLNYIYDCVTSQPPWDFPCGLTEPHSTRPHCIYHKPHLCHCCQHNNMSPFLFARFILSQCDSPISHIGSKSNWEATVGFHIVRICQAHGDTTAALLDKSGRAAELLSGRNLISAALGEPATVYITSLSFF